MDSPDFDTSYFPIVKASFKVNSDNTFPKAQPRKSKDNPPIYHHRWLFVKDDYTGFDGNGEVGG